MSLTKVGLALAFLMAGNSLTPAQQGSSQNARVSFEVVPVKTVYRPNEPIVLRLVLTNRGEKPVTVEHFSSLCSSDFFAFVDLKILDARGRESHQAGCAGDSFRNKEFLERTVADVGKTDHWIKLEPNDLYGEEEIHEVKARTGTYTIKAKFLPARFHEEERKALAQRGITVLSRKITAPTVMIIVR